MVLRDEEIGQTEGTGGLHQTIRSLISKEEWKTMFLLREICIYHNTAEQLMHTNKQDMILVV